MSLESNISVAQLIIAVVGTLVTVVAIVFSSYVSLKVENGRLEERVGSLEKRVDNTDENYKEIIKALGEIKVELKDKANRAN
jgi:chaperonin cofactor prefoldin